MIQVRIRIRNRQRKVSNCFDMKGPIRAFFIATRERRLIGQMPHAAVIPL